MLISETHLTTKNVFYIKNYFFYDTKHPNNKAHGGSGILIRRGIKHYMYSTISKTYLQATNIVIEEWSGNCVFSAVYCPSRFTKNKEHFSEFLKSLGLEVLQEVTTTLSTLNGALD